MKARTYIIYGVAAYLFFLLAAFPAEIAYPYFLGKARLRQIEMAGIQGPWWSGRISALRFKGVKFDNVNMRFRPLSLLIGRAAVSMQGKITGGYFRGTASKGLGGLRLKDLELRLPLALLDQFSVRYGVRLKGLMSADLSAIKIEKGFITAADGKVALNGAELETPQSLRLGDFSAKVSTENEQVRMTFTDGGGPVKAEGVAQLSRKGEYSFSGTFVVVDKSQPTLEDFLTLLGKPGSDGRITVSSTGKLPGILM